MLAALLAPLARAARAATWPSGVITYVVPYPPGGTTDILARTVTQKLADRLGDSVIVENKPGATGTIGGAFVAHARPDGYTLLGTSIGPQTIVPHLMPHLPYDAVRDYAPIILLATVPHILVVPKNSSYRLVADLVAGAKAKPGTLTFASGGPGTILQMQGELLGLQAQVQMIHVPYKGDTPAMQDTMTGQVTFAFIPVPAALPQVQAGSLNALAATSAERLKELPHVPTMTELGYKDFVVEQWQAIFAPAKTSPTIVQSLNDDINRILQDPAIMSRFESLGMRVVGGTPDDLARQQAADYARWGRVIKDAGITLN